MITQKGQPLLWKGCVFARVAEVKSHPALNLEVALFPPESCRERWVIWRAGVWLERT